MRSLNGPLLATLLGIGVAGCAVQETALDTAPAPVRQTYVTLAHTQLTACEIDLAKLALKLPKDCRGPECARGTRLLSAKEDLRLARSRLDELRLAQPDSWQSLKPAVDEALGNLSTEVSLLKGDEGPAALPVDPESCSAPAASPTPPA
jgi:hypothetical protein